MVQHVADWVEPFNRSQHSPPPPLKFFHTPLSPPPSSSPLKCTRVSGNHHHHHSSLLHLSPPSSSSPLKCTRVSGNHHHHPPCYLPFLLPTLAIIIIIRHVTGSSGVLTPSAAGCSPSTATFITAKKEKKNMRNSLLSPNSLPWLCAICSEMRTNSFPFTIWRDLITRFLIWLGKAKNKRKQTRIDLSECCEKIYHLHTEKSFQNLIKSNRNQIVFAMHRCIWNSKRTASVCCSKSIGAW